MSPFGRRQTVLHRTLTHYLLPLTSYLLPYVYTNTLPCLLYLTTFKLLLRIQINMRLYKGYIESKKSKGNKSDWVVQELYVFIG
jgi:hypothetical protein